MPQNKVASELDISSSYVTYLLNRSLGGAEHEDPQLTTALIPDYHIKTHRRKKTIESVIRFPLVKLALSLSY